MHRNGYKHYPMAALDQSRPTGLILCGMGGPDRAESVEPFLRNLFRDPAIFPLPRLLAPMLGAFIAKRRSQDVARRYRLMNPAGATPQLQSTIDQATEICGVLSRQGAGGTFLPGVAMRYWHPFPSESVPTLLEQGAEQFVVTPTYPQYSPATVGSTLDLVLKSLNELAPDAPVFTLSNWHSLDGYIDDLARPVIDQLTGWASEGIDPAACAVIYAAHSMPLSFIKKGDPYEKLTRETVALVHQKVRAALADQGHAQWLNRLLNDADYPLAYQSKVGPIKWLEPNIEAECLRLAKLGCANLMIQPVSFVCDNIETLVELDLELQEEVQAAGVTCFRRGPALNLQPGWLAAMAHHIATQAFRMKLPALEVNNGV